MSNTVLLFSGQGAQKVGMGKDLAEAYPVAKELFEKADAVLGRSISTIMFEGPDEALTKTANCQPALFLHGLALLEILKQEVPSLTPVATAGLSLGELTAHTAAGTFTFEEGLKLVARRGELMDAACAATSGSMAAVIGGDENKIQQLADDCDIDVANFNCPGQTVLSGTGEGVAKAVELAKEYGARMAKPLKVAGAYHSRLMMSAQEELANALSSAKIDSPKIPVIANFTAQAAESPDDIRHTLTNQVTGSVRWTESMNLLLSQNHSNFIELGPGKVLKGLMSRISKETPVTAIEDIESLKNALLEINS